MMLEGDGMDMNSPEMQEYTPPNYESNARLLEVFDDNVVKAREAMASTSDADWMATWTMTKGEEVMMAMPKIGVIRGFLLNHNVHHRGQLSVYLRLCDIPVPQTYGPSADETGF
jgi:uncharacterized damage-inducible protein DinB